MMFKSSLAVLSLSAALQLVLASSVTITTPEANAVWEAGSTVQIKWKVNNDTTGPIRLQYASGPSKSLKINGLIADHVDASLGKYSWKIPTSIKEKKYVIEAGPSAKDLSFAGYISIKNDKKTTTKKHTTKKHSTTKKHTTKKHSSTKKHSTTKKTSKKTTAKSKKTTAKAKKTHTKKTTTKKGGKPSAVCVGYPARGEGVNQTEEYVRCHSLPKGNAAKAQNNKKKTTSKKKHTTKKHSTKKHSTKKHSTTSKK
ncbi:hypothetical protein HMPREF1544_01178 [Mucor circinelloides 1006PhL]|uniref:Yeast cell wall synthesis Kre9/Knh1-like N-terminal domain-containing protein n=1 Tax=Mucor circinelloides f. circinelloides (strain 1006PhL) TaxID=1220926 RepID=S2JPN6_MUCC1|nr:hypothetical protein HMPREF1544_01178 [Mucor circinelloides 1006PhL]KAG1088325.1 hypothetical protein G6F42_020312 [Rhizopus arrhizus]